MVSDEFAKICGHYPTGPLPYGRAGSVGELLQEVAHVNVAPAAAPVHHRLEGHRGLARARELPVGPDPPLLEVAEEHQAHLGCS